MRSVTCRPTGLTEICSSAPIFGLFAGMPELWVFLATLVVVVTIAASAYPALVLCGVRAAHAPHGVPTKSGPRSLSTFLVGLQFAFAGFLLIAVFAIVAQNEAMRQAVADPSSDPIVVIANDIGDAGADKELLRTRLLAQPGVGAVGGMDFVPWGTSFRFAELTRAAEPGAAQVRASQHIVDPFLFEAMGIELVAGRNFQAQRAADVADVEAWRQSDGSMAMDFNVVIDAAVVQRMGFGSPLEAVGETIYRPTSETSSTPPQRLHVIGVVENSVIQPIDLGAPDFYLMNPDAAAVPVIRISKGDVATALAGIDSVWSELAPDVPLRRRFADEQYEASWGALEVVDDLFTVLASFASIIATMGLIGTALHAMRRRTREIAVRKVVGASVGQVLWMLLRNFSKPIVIANLAAWPIAYVGLQGYLSLFAIRSGLGPGPFVLSLLITLFVAWIAVGAQAARAARTHPVPVLRRE